MKQKVEQELKSEKINYRQIHLDFHTSHWIDSVAGDFDKEQFADRLAQANVDSITCFGRCHHGYLYYPSVRFKELIHPNLTNSNLLPEQIAACHQRGIRVPIYTTVQWDGRISQSKPEWLCIDDQGQYINTQNVPAPHFYNTICLNSGYREFFKQHLLDMIEVIGAENVDGLFMDILFPVACACGHCKDEMAKRGMDSGDRQQRLNYSVQMLHQFKQEITTLIRSQLPTATIFYNSSHIGPKSKADYQYYSHLELESLPSGGWGYDHFPATARYARKLGKPMIGMTGKFHTYWGDFHSLKNRAALEFECFQMLALGGGCSIGDQLHPKGRLSEAAYQLIGQVYGMVKDREAYCRGAVPVTMIGVLTPEQNPDTTGIAESLIGVIRLLQELSYQFDIIDSKMDFAGYGCIIAPDWIEYDQKLVDKLEAYVRAGGSCIGSYQSLINQTGQSRLYGIENLQKSPYSREFILPNSTIGQQLLPEEYVMYGPSYNVEPVDSRILVDKIRPYYERQGDKFCSHQHFPSTGQRYYPELVEKGRVLYFAHPVFELYRKNGAGWIKQLVKDSLVRLAEDNPRFYQAVAHNGPSTLVTALTEQPSAKRYVLHILHYITEKRYQDIYTIEDIIPLYNTKFQIKEPHQTISGIKEIGRIRKEPARVGRINQIQTQDNIRPLAYQVSQNQIELTIDEIYGYHMVIMDYQ